MWYHRKQLMWVSCEMTDVGVTEKSCCGCYRKELMWVLQKMAHVGVTEKADVDVTENSQ